ncbi:MAG: imidazole glycerol phosphate synthase subunit HisH [Burkholderiaceae bacterium]
MAAVGIVDYQAGNIRSIVNAFEHQGARVVHVKAAADLDGLTHLVLPGVGAFGHCAAMLRESGLVPAAADWALAQRRPTLGICVGMQLLADSSDEMGLHEGLGWIGGEVRRLQSSGPQVRIPHVGWNTARFTRAFGSFRAGEGADFYFDHSFAYRQPRLGEPLATCHHGEDFCAAVAHGNIVAAQFHPEKSQAAGARFLRAFLEM